MHFLQRQLEDIRTLMLNDKEARERDIAFIEQEKASLDLMRKQWTQQQNAQNPYREFGPWTTDANSIHVLLYPPYPYYPPYPQYPWPYPPGGYPGRPSQFPYGPGGSMPSGTTQQLTGSNIS